MRRTLLFSLVLALCAALLGSGCAITADEGAPSSVGQDPGSGEPAAADVLADIDADSRVVALSRSVGELWLLAGGTLVGATEDALDLPSISGTEGVESIGSPSRPSVEQVLALDPDLVMLTEDLPSHKEARGALEDAGVPVLVVDVDSFDDYADVMARLTAATGRDDLFERNVTAVAQQIDQVLAGFATEDRETYLALRTSSTKNKVLKSDYFACDMLGDLGLSNVADDTSTLDDLSLEAIAAADPDWVFVIYQGEGAEAQEAFEVAFRSNPVWSELRAVEQDHVVVLPKDLFQYKPNARWGEAYAYLSQVLHGAWA